MVTTGSGRSAQDAVAHVCVVDDDRSVRTSIVTLMRSIGVRASSFSSGEALLRSEGIAALRCLVLDLRLKTMSGLEVQQQLRLAGHALPIVFISAHADVDARDRALAAGAVAFLIKPFSQDELLDCVHRAMSGASPHDAVDGGAP